MQNNLFSSIQLLEQCDPAIFVKSEIPYPSADMHSLPLIKSLCRIVEFIDLNGNAARDLNYFLTDQQYEDSKTEYLYLYTSSLQFISQDLNKAKTKPEMFVPMLISAVIFMDYHCHYNIRFRSDPAERLRNIAGSVALCKYIIDVGLALSPALLSECDKYLQGTLGSDMVARDLISMVMNGCLSVGICLEFLGTTLNIGLMKSLLQAAISPLAVAYAASKNTPLLMSNSAFFGSEYQFNVLSSYARLLSLPGKDYVSPYHPFFAEWYEGGSAYLFLLERALRDAKECKDLYTIARIYRVLLHAILNGVSKDNVLYEEVEDVANELALAVEACGSWAPARWKADIDAELKIFHERFRPGFRSLKSKGDYKNFFILPMNAHAAAKKLAEAVKTGSQTSAGSIIIEEAKVKCPVCVVQAPNMRKCSAVS